MKRLVFSLLTIAMMSSTATVMADGPDNDRTNKDESQCETIEYCRRHIGELDQKILEMVKPHVERRAKALEVIKKEIGKSAQALRILVSKMKDSFFASEAVKQYVRVYADIESALRKSNAQPDEVDELLKHVTLDYHNAIKTALEADISNLLSGFSNHGPYDPLIRNDYGHTDVTLDGQKFVISQIRYYIFNGRVRIILQNFFSFYDGKFKLYKAYSASNAGTISVGCEYNNKGLSFDITEDPITDKKVLEVFEEKSGMYSSSLGILDINKNAEYKRLMEIRSRYQRILDILKGDSEEKEK